MNLKINKAFIVALLQNNSVLKTGIHGINVSMKTITFLNTKSVLIVVKEN